jgi:TetR/AcrR family transcriptional repressor of nem operon
MATTTTATPRTRPGATRNRILDVAERLAQVRGFNGFSYADVAAELGITTASVHYHFAGKEELGRALVARYTERFDAALAAIEVEVVDAARKLEAYVDLYLQVLRGERMCLCGMLAAEYETLPVSMKEGVLAFFDANERWLECVLDGASGLRAPGLRAPARDAARVLVGGLEGAMLVARPRSDVEGFRASARTLIASLTGV